MLWEEFYGLYLYPHIRPKNYTMEIIGLHLFVNVRVNDVGRSFLLFCIYTQYIQHIRTDFNFRFENCTVESYWVTFH